MSRYAVSATVTSAPTDVALKLNDQRIKIARDATGGWSGTATLDLPNSVSIEFRAVGIFGAIWSLEIKFSTLPPKGIVVKDYKHNDTIPMSLLSVFKDTIAVKEDIVS